MKKLQYYTPLLAAVMLAGLGIYYFLFERLNYFWWIILLIGAVFNMFIAWRIKVQDDNHEH